MILRFKNTRQSPSVLKEIDITAGKIKKNIFSKSEN
jgi:hypothetical protein